MRYKPPSLFPSRPGSVQLFHRYRSTAGIAFSTPVSATYLQDWRARSLHYRTDEWRHRFSTPLNNLLDPSWRRPLGLLACSLLGAIEVTTCRRPDYSFSAFCILNNQHTATRFGVSSKRG